MIVPSGVIDSPKRAWILDPNVVLLNHGSFGACPASVLEVQRTLRERLEREPVRFFTRELEPLLGRARHSLAAFLATSPYNLAWVPNATSGVNAVLRSLDFERDDELLTTNHAYSWSSSERLTTRETVTNGCALQKERGSCT